MRDSTRYKKVYPYLRQDPKFVPTNAFLSGADVPEISMGTIGDFYLKTQGPPSNSVLLYGPKSSLGWSTTPIELVGLNGDQGPKGDPGEPGPVGPSYDGKTGNTIWVTKQTGGAYSSLQDAINQSVSGDTILVGAGNWGVITLKGGVNLVGLQPPLGDKVVLSKILFLPSGGSAATNTVFVSNIRVSSGDDENHVLVAPDYGQESEFLGGNFRVSFSGCRFYRNNSSSNTNSLLKFMSRESDTESSVYLDNCIISTEGSQYSANLIHSSTRYLDLNGCNLWNGSKAIKAIGGTVSVSNCRFETNYAGPSISLEFAKTNLTLGESLIRNLGGNLAKGIQLVAASICAVSNTVFDISSGSGTACIDGPALSLCYYGNITAVTPQPNPITGLLSETRSTNISGALSKLPFTQVS